MIIFKRCGNLYTKPDECWLIAARQQSGYTHIYQRLRRKPGFPVVGEGRKGIVEDSIPWQALYEKEPEFYYTHKPMYCVESPSKRSKR